MSGNNATGTRGDESKKEKELRSLEDVVVDPSRPVEERIADFAAQIGDPYEFLVHGTRVRVGFAGKIGIDEALARLMGARSV